MEQIWKNSRFCYFKSEGKCPKKKPGVECYKSKDTFQAKTTGICGSNPWQRYYNLQRYIVSFLHTCELEVAWWWWLNCESELLELVPPARTELMAPSRSISGVFRSIISAAAAATDAAAEPSTNRELDPELDRSKSSSLTCRGGKT